MRDIYETYNSKYCYPGTTVLKNKLNIMNIEKLQTYEAKITAAKSLGLRKKGITGDFDEKNPLYGLYLFKRGFGGKVVELIGEFDLIINTPLYYLYKIAFACYHKIKQIKKSK